MSIVFRKNMLRIMESVKHQREVKINKDRYINRKVYEQCT